MNGAGQATPPSGTFRAVSAGSAHSCGVRTDGSITCWGNTALWEESKKLDVIAGPPSGIFRSISDTCAVSIDGSIACWGLNHVGQAMPPAGAFRSIDSRIGHCGVKDDGFLACWGESVDAPPSGDATLRSLGPVRSVSASLGTACAVRNDGTLTCWGRGYSTGAIKPPAGTFRSVSMGEMHACAVKTDGFVHCWGRSRWSENMPPPPAEPFL